jgi:hypothetical protein
VPTPASKVDPAAARSSQPNAFSPSKRQKLQALLITSDETLWPQIGAVGDQWAPRQVDSVDDLIATGGTAAAAVELLRSLGARVLAACFVVDLPELGGAARLAQLEVPVRRLVSFAGE